MPKLNLLWMWMWILYVVITTIIMILIGNVTESSFLVGLIASGFIILFMEMDRKNE